MELAHGELVTQRFLRPATKLDDFEFADHIGRRLTGVDDIALDRLADITFGIGRIVRQILNGFLAAPALVMDAGVDNQPAYGSS